MLKKLSGKMAIVTGPWRGIGAATARVLAQHGAQVVLTDVADGVHETAEKNWEQQKKLESSLHSWHPTSRAT